MLVWSHLQPRCCGQLVAASVEAGPVAGGSFLKDGSKFGRSIVSKQKGRGAPYHLCLLLRLQLLMQLPQTRCPLVMMRHSWRATHAMGT